MNLAELINAAEWDDIRSEPFLYCFLAEGAIERIGTDFLTLFSKLQRMEPNESNFRILILRADIFGHIYNIEEEEKEIDVVIGRNGTLNKEIEGFEYHYQADDPEFANMEVDYELSFASWEKWLGMEINKESMQKYTKSQIVARCMAEMTLHGFSQFEIRRDKEKLLQSIHELDAMTEEQKKEYPNWCHLKINLEKLLSI